MLFDTINEKAGGYLYSIFRIMIGALFFQHGLMKLFGLFGGTAAPLMSKMGLAGIIEFSVGLALIFGVLSRLSAFGGAALMIAAYFTAHAGKGLVPVMNGGELALVFFASFLAIMVYGNGKLSLENALLGKEIF